VVAPDGLRERKKQQTRASISAVATGMFIERGFDAVTIAEVASAADISKMTVTNYFPRKEDLVFDMRDGIVEGPGRAVQDRASGTSCTEAVRSWFHAGLKAGNPSLGVQGPAFARLVLASPTLRAAEREMWEAREARLALAIVATTRPAGRDAAAREVLGRIRAAVLAGVLRTVHDEARRRMLSAEQPRPAVTAAVRRWADAGFDLVASVAR